jgi:hypothetical protein
MIDSWGIPLLERNVINQKEIDQFLSQFRAKKPETQKWLKANLRNFLISDHEEVEKVSRIPSDAPQWLKNAFTRGDELFTVSFSKEFKD